MCGWFRDQVKEYAHIARPLEHLTRNYVRGNLLKWTEEAKKAFDDLKREVNTCPKLFWMDDTSPIFLDTDASLYGYGAYLYQVIECKECPTGFISKSFDARELNWDVPQKEGYAIFYALNKWDYLLRYRRFTLRTDHDNLTRLKREHGDRNKVQRWFKCFQSFDYTIQHLKGAHNLIADAFSRLCAINDTFKESEHYSKYFLCPLVELEVPNGEIGQRTYR